MSDFGRKTATVILRSLLMALLGWIMLEITSGYPSVLHCGWFVLNEGWQNWCMNMFVMLSLLFVSWIIFRPGWRAMQYYLIFCYLLSLVNGYMTLMHGSPFSIAELKNVFTAANVIRGYSFHIDLFIIISTVVFIAGLVYVRRYVRRITAQSETEQLRNRETTRTAMSYLPRVITGLILFTAGYILLFFIPDAPHRMHSLGGSYHLYGYPMSMVEMIYDSFYKVDKPAGYDEERTAKLIQDLEAEEAHDIDTADGRTTPDIILILNESFCDLTLMGSVHPDRDPMDGLRSYGSSGNTLSIGNCIVPGICGGTNRTEYELLTGNSMYLIPQDTPFNLLDMRGATSIVSDLKKAGYKTTAIHPKSAINYQRGKQYPSMGFDAVYFGDSFPEYGGVGSSDPISDSDVYDRTLEWYKEAVAEKGPDEAENGSVPQFIYCLTYQNHGGYERYDESYDTVHVMDELGDITDDVNEYMSGIDRSVEAFTDLLDRLAAGVVSSDTDGRTGERPVMVIMIGDHAPPIAGRLPCYSEDEELVRRMVPVMCWSNCGIDFSDIDGKTLSINYLCSMILKKTGITASPIYRYQQELISAAPVITTYGFFYEAGEETDPYHVGARHGYDEESVNASAVRDYLALVYAEISQ